MIPELEKIIAQCEADSSLFEPGALRRRLETLDALDGIAGGEHTMARAERLRWRIESSNNGVYNSIRDEIQKSGAPSQLLHWIERCGGDNETPQPGLSYDVLDELISGVLQAKEPEASPSPISPEMVFYQPTPVRHILSLIRRSALSQSDTLVDLGAGLGHVPILASILTGARCIGVEVHPAYVATARACASALRLERITFVIEDAADANLAGGTVFYLYTPFTGNTLKTVLQRLRKESSERAITVCTLGPCTRAVADESWLTAYTNPSPEEITVFRSAPNDRC